MLTVGPVGLIGLSYVTSAPQDWQVQDWQWQQAWSDVTASAAAGGLTQLSETPPERFRVASSVALRELPESWAVVERYPFLVTGNVSVSRMQRALDQVVFPTYRALMIDYFDTAPPQPITLMLLEDDQSFVDTLGRMGYAGKHEYAGVYIRRDRRLLLNLSTGEGTIAHELTHALAHADFMKMPEWFDEGLAALHEESEFTPDGRRLMGLPNWRDELLDEALRSPKPPKLEALVTGRFGRHHPEVDYAFARTLCRYLQSQQLLGAYYRKCRARIHEDPTGGRALLEICGCEDFADIDQRLGTWFRETRPKVARVTAAKRQ